MMGNVLGMFEKRFAHVPERGMRNPIATPVPAPQNTQDYLDKYLNPYINNGQQANQTLNGQYNNLLGQNPSGQYQNLLGNNPSGQYQGLLGQNPSSQYEELTNNPQGVMNRMGSGFQQSPGYQYNVDQATRASNNAAAAGGFIGNPQQQAQLAKEIGGMASQDYNQYLNNAMGLYGQGLQGKANMYGAGLQGMGNLYGTGLQGMGNMYGAGLQGLQGFGQQGFQASGAAGQTLADMLKHQAQMGHEREIAKSEEQYARWAADQQKDQQKSNGMGGLLGTLGGMFSAFNPFSW